MMRVLPFKFRLPAFCTADVVEKVMGREEEAARREGREEGREEVRGEEKAEMARKLLAKGFDEAMITELTGLSSADLGQLKAKPDR